MDSKECSKCKAELPRSEFYKNKRSKDGLRPDCKACTNEQQRQFKANNPEKVRENRRREYERNRDKELSSMAAYYAANADSIKSNVKVWQKDNAGKTKSYKAKNKASRKLRRASWANDQAIAAFYAEAERLEQETGIKYHVDHIIPLNGKLVSGLHVENNLQVIPANENLSKSNHYEVA